MLVREITKQEAQKRLLKKYWLERSPTFKDYPDYVLSMYTDVTVVQGASNEEVRS